MFSKLFIVLALLSFFKLSTAQDFKSLINTPYFDIITQIVPLTNGGFVAMEIIPGKDFSTFDILKSDDIDDYGFSNISLYNKNGLKTKSLKLPDTDSTIFYTSQMIILSDGSYCVAGDHLNNITGEHNLFFAIVASDLSEIININIIDIPNIQSCGSVIEYFNGDLIFMMSDGDEKLKQYNKDGVFIREFNLSTNTSLNCISFGVRANTIYFLNKKLYFYCRIMDRFLVLDEFFNQSIIDLEYFPSLNNKKIKALDYESVQTSSNEIIFKAAIVDTSIFNNDSIYAAVFKIDTFNTVTPLFSDTSKSISSNTFRYRNPAAISNNIYLVFNDDFSNKTNFVIYSLKPNGALNWKKHIYLNLPTSNHSGYLTGNCVLSDGCFLFTVLVDDNYGHSDVYYYKVDSLGNPSDFETGIFSFGPKLEINDFALFPNPIQNKLSIETTLKGNFKLNVFNILGEKINTYTFENSAILNLEKLNKGTYFYTISNQENKQLQEGKFLKK